MDTTIQVRQRGTMTLPSELREKYGIQEGDTFRVIDLDGICSENKSCDGNGSGRLK